MIVVIFWIVVVFCLKSLRCSPDVGYCHKVVRNMIIYALILRHG